MQKATSIRQKDTLVRTQSQDQLLEQNKFFEVMYIQNNEDQTVEVYESTVLDFNAIINNLNDGNSIFITKKQPKKQTTSRKRTQKDGYINHI